MTTNKYEEITTYKEWLRLDDKQFRILLLIALKNNKFVGNLSDICRYFSLSTSSSKNTTNIRTAINELTKHNYIKSSSCGRTYTLTLVPKDSKIKTQRYILETFLQTNTRQVSKIKVIKVYLWIIQNNMQLCTNAIIAQELNFSEDTITAAKNVLEYDYNAIKRETIKKCPSPNVYITEGQIITPNAWIDT